MDATEEQDAARGVAAQRRGDVERDVRRLRRAHRARGLMVPVPRLVDLHRQAFVVGVALEPDVAEHLHVDVQIGGVDRVVRRVLSREELVVALHIRVSERREARVVAAGGLAFVGEQRLAERVELDAQSLRLDEVLRQTDEFAHLAGDLVHPVGGQLIAEDERAGERGVHEVERLVVPLVLIDALAGLAEVVRGGGVHRHHAHVVRVVA